MHHKNLQNVLYNLDVNPADTYTMVFIGHPLCEKDSGNTCKETVAYGITDYALNTSVIFTYDDAAFEHMTVFHEFGHLVGAPDHYGQNGMSTSWFQLQYYEAGFDIDCIYSERCVNDSLENHRYIVETRILCDGCKSFVNDYLPEFSLNNGV